MLLAEPSSSRNTKGEMVVYFRLFVDTKEESMKQCEDPQSMRVGKRDVMSGVDK